MDILIANSKYNVKLDKVRSSINRWNKKDFTLIVMGKCKVIKTLLFSQLTINICTMFLLRSFDTNIFYFLCHFVVDTGIF